MEEKKYIKISLKTAIFIACIVLVIVGIAIYFIINNVSNKSDSSKYIISNNVSIKNHNNEDYYIIEKDYSGEYDLQYLSLSEYYDSKTDIDDIKDDFEVEEVMSYKNYKSYCEKWGLETKYSDNTKNYIIFSYLGYGAARIEARLANVEYNNNNVDIYIWDHSPGITGGMPAYVLIIPTDNNVNNINIVPVYTKSEYKNIQKYNQPNKPEDITVDKKPIIYLYPTEESEVSVKLLKDEDLTCSYPKYTNKWSVLAKPNGDLKDLNTNRNLYSLYYESKCNTKFQVQNYGFIVKGEDTIEFLEEKLDILGLTEREAEEFIIYWLPKLETNKYNYIRFATLEEINENMPLEINPKPDTIIRILMTFKGLENPIYVEEQELTTPERNGFVAVEWGGTEIK